MKIAEIPDLDRVLIVGSLLRKDQPLLANRFRQAAKRHQQISVVNSIDEDMLVKLRHKAIVRPLRLPALLKEICVALAQEKQQSSAVAAGPVSQVAVDIAKSLASGKNVGIFLGAAAEQHPQASALQVLAQEIARLSGGRLGFFGTAANAVGGYAAQCVPAAGSAGLNAGAMISSPRNAYVLLNVEPELDCHDASAATRAIRGAECVVALSAFASSVQDHAQVVLPIAPFTETSGSFINTEGRLQSFNAAVKPLGEARPAWKVLRVLAERLGLQGFDFDTSEAIRDAVCRADEVLSRLDNGIAGIALADAGRQVAAENLPALERIADVPIYFADPLVRRAQSLQATKDAREPTASMNAATAARSGLSAGDKVKLRQGTGEAQSRLTIDEGVADGCVRFAAAHQAGASLGAMFGEISVERMS
jgi:NADH-quinone oxidoreductase subunit G